MHNSLPAIISIHIATLLFGLAGVLGAAVDLGPIEITFGRTLFASIALLAVFILSGKVETPVITRLSVFAGLLLAIHWISFFASILHSTVAVGLITFSTCPVFVALLEPKIFSEKFRPVTLIAALFVLVGVFIITGAATGDTVFIKGIAYGIFSGASFAVLQLINRHLAKTSGPVATSLIQNSVASLLLLPVVGGGLAAIQSNQWLTLAFLGVGCTALAHTLFIYSLKRVRVATASMIAAGLEPVYGIALAAVLLAQWPGHHVFVGGFIILATVLLISGKSVARTE